MNDIASIFFEAVKGSAITPPERIVIDDKIHRWRSGEDKADNSWYILHQRDNIVVGGYGDWKRNISKSFCSKDRSTMTPQEVAKLNQVMREAKELQAKAERDNQDKVRKKCSELFSRAPRAKEHPYLSKKQIQSSPSTAISTYEVYEGWLAVPLQDMEGTIHSAQFIADDGTKRYFYEGRVRGCFHQFADVNHGGPVIICEGYATGASLHLSTGWTTVCAMTCHNLESVAKDFRKKYPERSILIAADNDQWTEGNPGLNHAQAAAKQSRCLIAIPEFADEVLGQKPTDFNDLHRLAGTREVKRQVHSSFPILKLLESRLYNPNIVPPEVRPIYFLDDTPICTPANLSNITSAIKTGKSAVVGAMGASTMADPEKCDLLGFQSSNPESKALIHIDSEQSPEDHWHTVERMVRRAGLKEPPSWLMSYCLTGLNSRQALECLIEAMRIGREECGGNHSVLVDGWGDLVTDVNDPAECNDFVAKMHSYAIEYFCPIIGIIHFNPSTEKSRGHLGSQLERKAETNLTLEKDQNQVTVMYSTKNRRSGIAKTSGPCFVWSDEYRMHVSCKNEISEDHRNGRPNKVRKIASMNLASFLQQCPPHGEGKKEISRRLELYLASQSLSISLDTAKRAIDLCVENQKLSKSTTTGLFFKGPNA